MRPRTDIVRVPQLIDMTGASVTNKGKPLVLFLTLRRAHSYVCKGIYYEPGKEPPAEGPPKLHLLIESNEEWRVSGILRDYRQDTEMICIRWNKLSGRSNGCLSRHQPLRCRPRCGILLRQREDTVWCERSCANGRCSGYCTRHAQYYCTYGAVLSELSSLILKLLVETGRIRSRISGKVTPRKTGKERAGYPGNVVPRGLDELC